MEFLEPYLDAYDGAVFSAPEYIPRRLARRATVVFPGIDPLAPKNRDLSLRRTIEIMCSGGLIPCPGPTVPGPFAAWCSGSIRTGPSRPANVAESIGLLTRPDRDPGVALGPAQGLRSADGRIRGAEARRPTTGRAIRQHRRRLDLVRLVLAGPEPAAIQDDPEAREVLEELRAAYRALHPAIQDDVALLLLPMGSLEENALLVNALQRASTIVVQNSLREGFGLTIAEAMWKRVPVLTNSRACGPRQQVRDGLDGRLIADPENPDEMRRALDEMLADPDRLERWGQSAQRRVHDQFLVLGQLRAWGKLLTTLLGRLEAGSGPPHGRPSGGQAAAGRLPGAPS